MFGALSTNVGFAEHRGHHATAGTGARATGTAAPGQAKQAAEGPQSSAPSRAVSDQINKGAESAGIAPLDKSGKHAADPSRPRAKTPSSDATANGGRGDAIGQPRLAASGNGAKENGMGAPIDTRITVHQGRQAPKLNQVKEIRELKERLLKQSKTAIAPAIDAIRLSIHNHQQTFPLRTDGAPVRNAVGAITERRATIPQSGPSVPSEASRQGSGLPAADVQGPRERSPGTASTGDTAKQPGGPVPSSGASSAQPVSHPPKTTALAIVTANAAAISGAGMMRPESGGGAVGGPARVVTGVINGSSFRPKHP
jgi:hypothetical protein